MNKSLPKWIYASVSKHFDTNRQGVHLYFEGDDRDTAEEQEYAEFRCSGPNITIENNNDWLIKVKVNILITVAKGNENVYRIHEIGGIFQAAFVDIPIYKYGDEVADDDSLLFCLRLNRALNHEVRYMYLGQVEKNTDLVQAVVDGDYQIHTHEV